MNMFAFVFLMAAALGVFVPLHAEEAPRVLLPAARDFNAPGGLPLRKLLDMPMRDPNITRGPDGFFYLTGTTDPAPGYTKIHADDPAGQMWTVNDGIRLWKSPDLIHWQPLGLVWSLDKEGTWARWWPPGTPNPGSAIWAPEIHYLKGTYWIPYCTKLQTEGLHLGAGLLRSVSGKPEGPYKDVQPSGPLGLDDDASLFQDTDGTVYFLFGGYKIARMKDDMSGLAEAPRDIAFQTPPGWGEGIFLVKVQGKYIFINSGNPHGEDKNLPDTYDCFSAVSTGSIYGPYTPRYRAIPHAGHNNLFQDKQGQWWSTYFGSDPTAPLAVGASGRPAVLPVTIAADGTLRARRNAPRPVWQYRLAPQADWKTGGGAFGDPAVANGGDVTDVGTIWTTGDLQIRRILTLTRALKNPHLFLRHSGPLDIVLNGRPALHLDGNSSDYVTLPLSKPALLRLGVNTISARASVGTGPAYVDIALVDLPVQPVPVPVVFTSEATNQTWRYVTQTPPTGWQKAAFDDSAWQTGMALFGQNVPGVNTPWTSSDIWIRRTFTLTQPIKNPQLRLFHDEDAEVYIDGEPAARESGFVAAYGLVPLLPQAAKRLTPGAHTLAAHCRNTIGGQGIDVGIVELR